MPAGPPQHGCPVAPQSQVPLEQTPAPPETVHVMPSVLRVQPVVSVYDVVLLQEPDPQVSYEQVRDMVPVWSHVLVNPPQEP